jgi:hypothetical protein
MWRHWRVRCTVMSVKQSMAQVVGANARALRLGADVKLEEFAATARFYGLKWTSGRVGDFEAGRTAPTLPTIIVVAAVLSNLLGRKVAPRELFEGQGRVTINDRLSLDLSAVRSVFGKGAGVTALDLTHVRDKIKRSIPEWAQQQENWPEPLRDVPPAKIGRVYLAMSDSDLRMCRNIGVDKALGAAAMTELWDKPFTAKRDELAELAGQNVNAQKLGQISRQLKAELQKVVNGGDD